MKIIFTSNLDPWNNKYSICAKQGEIVKFIENIPTQKEICLLFGDGISQINYKEDYEKHNIPTNILIACLCSRKPFPPLKHNIIYLPLDDETFKYGLQYVLQKDINNINLQWEQRKPIAYWRGVVHPIRKQVIIDLFDCEYTNIRGVLAPWLTPVIDIKYYDNRINKYHGRPVPMEEHIEHKYILIIDGFLIASSLQWVFGSGSVPILITHPNNDFWFKDYLIPDVNCILIYTTKDLSAKSWSEYNTTSEATQEIKEKIKYLIEHDDFAKGIAENAKLLANRIFNPEFQQKYIIKKLT